MNNTDIKLVSVIIPVYNEEASLPVLLSRVTAACELLHQDYEVILIDDGSHDGSTEIISEAAANSDSTWLSNFVADGTFWELLAYCAGTGGSCLIIGSAAGVAAMGMEKIDFIWYLKKISGLALLGYLAGAATYIGIASLG